MERVHMQHVACSTSNIQLTEPPEHIGLSFSRASSELKIHHI
jgi:hypothetical protein